MLKEKLLNVKKIVVHKYCHDGTSSAMIIKDVLHDAEVFFADHKDKEYLELPAEPGILFCDISPPPERFQEFMDVGAIILDHHEKTKKEVLIFEEAGLGKFGESEEGVSGAVLAYNEVWLPLQDLAKTPKEKVCRLSRLAGIRDTFQKDNFDWELCQIQTEAIAFFPYEHFFNDHLCEITDEEMKIGSYIFERNKSSLQRAVNGAFTIYWNNLKVAVIPGHRIISDAAEELRKKDFPITFAFQYAVSSYGNPQLRISTRSDGTFNCNQFASFYGGGGHIPAAGGIAIDVKDNSLNPYSVILEMLNSHGLECMIAPEAP